MKPLKLKLLFMRKGITQKSVAESLGVSSMHVNHVVHGRSKNKTTQEAIAKALGVEVKELFPEKNISKKDQVKNMPKGE